MRPGTVDYSRWASVGASDSDEEAAPLAQAPAPAPARRAPLAEALANLMNVALRVSHITADDVVAIAAWNAATERTTKLFLREVVPLLLANKAALRVAGAPAQGSVHHSVFYSEGLEYA